MDENVEPLWGALLDDPAAIEPIPPRIYRSYFDVTTKDQQRGWKKSDIVSPNLKSSDVSKATETTISSNKKSSIIPFKEISKNQENVEPLWGELLKDPATIEPRPPRIYRNYFDGSTKDQQTGLMRSVIVSPNLKSSDVGKAMETTRFSNQKTAIIPFKEICKNQVFVCKQQLLCGTEMEDKQNSSITCLQQHIGGITQSCAATACATGGALPLVRLKKPDPPKRKTTRGGVSDENATQMMVFSSVGNEKGKPTCANGGAPPLVPLKKHDPPERKTTRGGVSNENATQMMVFSSLGNEKGKPTRANGGASPLVPLKKPDLPKRKITRGGVSDENATQMMVFSSLGNEKGKPTRANGGVPPLVPLKKPDPSKRKTIMLIPLKKPDPPERRTTRGGASDENAAQMMSFSSLGNEKGKPKDAVSDTMGQQKGRAKRPVLTNLKCNIGPEMKVKMTDLCAGMKKGREKRPAPDVDTHNGAGTTLIVPNKRRASLREVPNILSDGMLTGSRAFVMNPDTINGDTTSFGIVNIDCEKSNILMCSIYASDIYSNFRANELIGRPSSDFLERLQTDVTQNKRAVLMDWLVEVCQEYSLVPDTLHLTVNLIDRFLSMNKIERQRLQLLGVTCMLIASKYEETRATHVRDLCLLTCNSYNENEVLQMERQVLSVVGYNLSVPTIKTFLRRFLRAALASSKAHPELMHLTNYLAELALVEYSFLEFLPSMIAAAAVFLGQWNLDQSTHPWNKTLAYYTGYKSSDMKKCILALRDLQVNTKNCPLKAIRFKYWHNKYSSVAYQTSPELPDYLFC